ncbi:MAG: DNA-binding protein [Acetatifactor sp.]|nr:DNA-binding protein [Acetatifactor sp.]
MDKIYEQTMLFDFYGELLTEHQRRIYEDVVYNDMSLGEIAEEQGISRQGVHDLVRRCDRILQGYENKLHLVERFARAKATVSRIEQLTMEDQKDGIRIRENLIQIRKLSRELLAEL